MGLRDIIKDLAVQKKNDPTRGQLSKQSTNIL